MTEMVRAARNACAFAVATCTPGALHVPRVAADSIDMIQLVYASAAAAPFTTDRLRELLVRARATNATLDISGVLIHLDGSFLQVLEGDPEVVNRLFARISADPRHARVLKLLERELDSRNFADWTMGFIDASGRASSVSGYRPITGFADLIGDPKKIVQVVEDFRNGRWRTVGTGPLARVY